MKYRPLRSLLEILIISVTAAQSSLAYWEVNKDYPLKKLTDMEPLRHAETGEPIYIEAFCIPLQADLMSHGFIPQFDIMDVYSLRGNSRSLRLLDSMTFDKTVYSPRSIVYDMFAFKLFFGYSAKTGRLDDIQVVSSMVLEQDITGFTEKGRRIVEVRAYRWDPEKKEESRGQPVPMTFAEYSKMVAPKTIAAMWVDLDSEKVWFKTGFNRFLDEIIPLPRVDEEMQREINELRHSLFTGSSTNALPLVEQLYELSRTKRLDVAHLLVDTLNLPMISSQPEVLDLIEKGIRRYPIEEIAPLMRMSSTTSTHASCLWKDSMINKPANDSYLLIQIFSDLLQSKAHDPYRYMNKPIAEASGSLIQKMTTLGSCQTTQAAAQLIEKLKNDFGQTIYSPHQEELIPAIRIMKEYYGDAICPLIVHTALTTDDDDLRTRCAIAFRAIASPKMTAGCIRAFGLFPEIDKKRVRGLKTNPRLK